MKWIWFFLLPIALFSDETVVESNEAYYDGAKITLVGNVMLENAMGKVACQTAILTRDESGMTKFDFPWIELKSGVTLTLADESCLNCEQVALDYTKMTSLFTGMPQVTYTNTSGKVLADSATVDYAESNKGSLQATRVTLMRNVRLIYLESDQYALADLVTYYPEKKLMVMEGRENNRVLFFDKKRNMQLSAHTIHAERNVVTGKDSVQGVGDVRFIFGEEELTKLKERFQW